MAIKIRELTIQDRYTMTGLLDIMVERTGNVQLKDMIPSNKKGSGPDESGDDEDSTQALIAYAIKAIIDVAEKELGDWFADLLGVTREAYLQMPFDIEVQVIEALTEREEFSNFFAKALRSFKKIKGIRQ